MRLPVRIYVPFILLAQGGLNMGGRASDQGCDMVVWIVCASGFCKGPQRAHI